VPPAVQPAELTDTGGRAVQVSGRGELSAPPATLAIAGRPPLAIIDWAGPWPLDERWWEPRRHRRLARLQVVTADGAAHLVLAERRHWWVAASYG
jgi:protein ImuB